jgi:hypothetical protein
MREVKFRAWHKNAEILSYPNEDGEFEFISNGTREASDRDGS